MGTYTHGSGAVQEDCNTFIWKRVILSEVKKNAAFHIGVLTQRYVFFCFIYKRADLEETILIPCTKIEIV